MVGTLAELGLHIPRDLSLVGFGHPAFEFWPATPLTVISHDVDAIGREAARLLLERLRTRQREPVQRLVLPCALDVRGSTGPASLSALSLTSSTGEIERRRDGNQYAGPHGHAWRHLSNQWQ